jgi:hypothetical protein
MDTPEAQANQQNDARQDYEAPRVTVLGKVDELTHGNAAGGTDVLLVSA